MDVLAATLYPERQQAMATISEVLREIGAAGLKEKQREALLTFLSGRDTFVVAIPSIETRSFTRCYLALHDLLNHHH